MPCQKPESCQVLGKQDRTGRSAVRYQWSAFDSRLLLSFVFHAIRWCWANRQTGALTPQHGRGLSRKLLPARGE